MYGNANPVRTERLNFMMRLKRYLISTPLEIKFTKINQIIRGWINCFRIGSMKGFIESFEQWLRHGVRVIIMKQWK